MSTLDTIISTSLSGFVPYVDNYGLTTAAHSHISDYGEEEARPR